MCVAALRGVKPRDSITVSIANRRPAARQRASVLHTSGSRASPNAASDSCAGSGPGPASGEPEACVSGMLRGRQVMRRSP